LNRKPRAAKGHVIAPEASIAPFVIDWRRAFRLFSTTIYEGHLARFQDRAERIKISTYDETSGVSRRIYTSTHRIERASELTAGDPTAH